MKNYLLFLLLGIMCSCSFIMPNCTKHFNVFKNPIKRNANEINLKTEGIYISEDGRGSFFLYKNGKVKIHGPFFDANEPQYWKTPQKVIETMTQDEYFNAKEWWGDYEVTGKKIKVQWFNRHSEELCKRWVFEERGEIINDSTIEIYFDYSYWRNRGEDSILRPPTRLNFYPVNNKPDSTKAWFNKKKWYKEELHESRKL